MVYINCHTLAKFCEWLDVWLKTYLKYYNKIWKINERYLSFRLATQQLFYFFFFFNIQHMRLIDSPPPPPPPITSMTITIIISKRYICNINISWLLCLILPLLPYLHVFSNRKIGDWCRIQFSIGHTHQNAIPPTEVMFSPALAHLSVCLCVYSEIYYFPFSLFHVSNCALFLPVCRRN